MNTEEEVTPVNAQSLFDEAWPKACQILEVNLESIEKPELFWGDSDLLYVFGVSAKVGYMKRTNQICLNLDETIYLGELAHEIGHAITYRSPKYAQVKEREEFARQVESE